MNECVKQIVLNQNAINKLNEVLSNMDVIKNTQNLFIYCLENEIYVDKNFEINCFAYVLQTYLEKLKTDYANILKEENLIA